ncbi:MAG TPA: S9 family peptidase [Gemmatimonadales bacterium]|nr:S9 family peptidase [Gemmatimonadales bacterium]
MHNAGRRRPRTVILVVAFLTALSALRQLAYAQEPPLIPRRILFGTPERSSPRLSPDGERVAYLAIDAGVLNVWVRTLGRNDDRPVTAERGRPIRRFAWRGDSRHILYQQDTDGDESWHLFQVDTRTGETRDLTPFENVQAQIVALEPARPHEMLVALNRRDRRFHDVYRLDLRTGALTLDTENPGDVVEWVADHALRVRLAQATAPDGSTELRVRDGAHDPWRVLRVERPDESFGAVLGFSADDRKVWVVSSADADAARLLQLDTRSGEATVVAADPQFDVNGALLDPWHRAVQAVNIIRERPEWVLVDSSLAAEFERLHAAHAGVPSVVSRDLNDRRWIVQYERADGPLAYRLYDRRSGRITRLFSERSALAPYAREPFGLAPMQPITFTARDGMTLYGYLTLPRHVAPRGLPLVLLVHGGPWERDVWGYDPEVQLLANRGYAVLQVNYRGSTGYGKAYLNAGNREWAGKMQDDLVDAKRWAVAQGYADSSRVCLVGTSYGGYATLVGLAFTPDEFRCGIAVAGPSSLLSLLRSIPAYWTGYRAVLDKRLGGLEADSVFLRERSPIYRADQIAAPLLIVQGANDPRVPRAESDQLVAAMRRHGRAVDYIVFPDEGHGFVRPENRLRFYAAAEAFLARHLGGRAEPPWEGESVAGFLQ